MTTSLARIFLFTSNTGLVAYMASMPARKITIEILNNMGFTVGNGREVYTRPVKERGSLFGVDAAKFKPVMLVVGF
jgi:hypothetical protein